MGTTTHRASQLPEPSKAHRAAMAAAEPVAAAAAQSASGVLTREILAPAAVVVLGAIMTILDATIVNVALPTLGADLHTSIGVIQWVSTAYLLAFAAVIPLSGWAAGRFGAKTVWLASLGVFMAGSLLAGLSSSIGALIGARVVQGAGGGMIMPLGQAMLAQVAGPRRPASRRPARWWRRARGPPGCAPGTRSSRRRSPVAPRPRTGRTR